MTGGTFVNLAKIGTDNLGMVNDRGEFIPLQKGYISILDKAVTAVQTGGEDFHTAMRDALKSLGGGGLRVNYGHGISRRLDTCVRQAMMYGAKQASNEYQEMIGEELGCDGIEIDWHSCPRPSHKFMQGRQFAIGEGRTVNGKFYPSAKLALERLEDYNCYHYKSPIILGVSEPTFDEGQLAELNKRNETPIEIDGVTKSPYEWTQKMREIESEIRNKKTEIDLLKSSGDNEAAKAIQKETKPLRKRIKTLRQKYANISEQSGIAEDPSRLTVIKGGEPPKSGQTITHEPPPKAKAQIPIEKKKPKEKGKGKKPQN